MKRYVLLACVLLGGFGSGPSFAAERPLDILAARQELEDFLRTTNTRLSALEEAAVAQRKLISELQAENLRLRQELDRIRRVNPAAGLERDVQNLAKDIKEVDRKRMSDNRLTLDKLERLESLLRARAKTPSPSPRNSGAISRNVDLKKIEVQKGDTLYGIVARLRADNIKVTAKEIEKANPGVVWTKLQIGQEIFIPVPKD